MRKALVATTVLLLVAACGKSEGGADGESTPEATKPADPSLPTASIGTVGVNPLQDTFPRGLAIDALQAAVTQPVDANTLATASAGTVGVATLALQNPVPPMGPPVGPGPQQPQTQPAKRRSFADDLAEQDQLLKGEVDCLAADVLAPAVINPPSGDTCFRDGEIQGKYPYGGQNEPKDEACVVITARREVERARDLLYASTRLQLALLCQVKKSGKEVSLPAAPGETVDLKAELEAAAAKVAKSPTIEYARITRLADDGGKPLYRTDVKIAASHVDGGGNDLGVAYKEVHLVNSPAGDEAGNFRGIVWTKQWTSKVKGTFCENDGYTYLGASFAKSGAKDAPRLKFEVRKFDWASDAEPVLASGLLDPNTGAQADGSFAGIAPGGQNHNARVCNIRYLNFDINPLDGAGSVSTWLNDGAYTTAARGLATTFKRRADKLFEGCGVAGAAGGDLSIRKALKTGTALKLPTSRYFQVYRKDGAVSDAATCVTPGSNGQPDQLKAGCTQSGESDDKVYIQCFAQTPAGLYDIAILDGSADKVKVVVNDAVRTAPFNVDEPDLADVVAFGQDVRPKP